MDIWWVVMWIWMICVLLSFVAIGIDLLQYGQRMKIMIWVWLLCSLWGGPFVFWMYLRYGRNVPPKMSSDASTKMDMSSMGEMHSSDKMNAMNSDASMKDMPNMPNMKEMTSADGMKGMSNMKGMSGMMNMAGMSHPMWVKVMLSAFHCGAGCSLADIIGEWIGFIWLRHVAGWSLFAQWGLDYVLALIIGVLFQYAVVHKMMNLSVGASLWRALKIDFFSLTSWQIGMYAFVAFFIYVYPKEIFLANNLMFWFMMQCSMIVGLVFAYPTNYVLIRLGIKKGM